MNANEETRVTDEDLRTLRAIDVYRRARGYSPTVRELAALLHRGSTSVVHLHLRRLERGGLLECPGEPGSRRRYSHAVLTAAGDLALRLHPALRFAFTPPGAGGDEGMARPAAEGA